jgi:cell division septal protein FtsQ
VVVTDAPLPPHAAGLPIDPRIRERLVAVQRAQGRRRLKIMVAIVAVVVLAAAALAATRLPLLAVQHVEVTGDVHTPRASVLAVTRLDRHPQLIDLNSGRLRRELMTLPWVASAQIHRRWPATVAVHLSERRPVAEVTGPEGQPAVVDRDGRVLATGAAVATALAPASALASAPASSPPGAPGLPGLKGVGQAGAAGTYLAPSSGVRDVLALALALPPVLSASSANQLRAIEIGKQGMLQATLAPGVTVLFGSIDALDAKLLALRTLLERVDLRGVTTLDVRVPTAPSLTHQGQASTVSTIPRG